MPRVVFIPNYFKPYDRETVLCRVGVPISRALPAYLDTHNCQFIHCGKVEEINPDEWKFTREDDEVICRVLPGYIGSALVGGIAGAIIDLIVSFAVSFAIGQIVNALLPAPKNKNTGFTGEESPNYGWDGIQNTNQNGMPIQVCYGKHKIAGQYLSTYTEARNDGTSELSMLVGLCAGEVSAINGYTSDQDALTAANSGTGLTVDTNAGSLFTGMTTSYRRGAWDQSIIAGFENVTTQYDVSQVLGFAGTSGTGYVYTTTTDVEQADIILTFPSGLYSVNARGAQLAKSCAVSYRYREDDAAAAWSSLTTETYTASTRSRWNAMHSIVFPHHGKYQIDIKRVTAIDGSQSCSVVYVTGVKEIEGDDLSYRGIALCGVKAVASEQLNGRLPSISCVVHGRKVKVYHPDDDFGADTQQEFTADGEALWGWTAQNTSKMSSFISNDYATHILTLLHAAASSNMYDTTFNAPNAYKVVNGDFIVSVRAQNAGDTVAATHMGIYVRSTTDLNDWSKVGKYRNVADTAWYVLHTPTIDGASGSDTQVETEATYLRWVRSGSTLSAYYSIDGIAWTLLKQETRADLAGEVRIGLYASSSLSSPTNLRANFSDFHFDDSTAYSTECSSNPAWVIYDLLTDTHYGIGSHIDTTQIDLDSFIAFADHCNGLVGDGNGGTHRRHRFDGLIDTQRAAWETLNRVAENSRAAVLRQGARVRVLWQADKTAVQLFAMSNIKAGSFSQVYQSPEVGGNFWEVQYLNADNDYEQDFATYIDPDIPAGEPYRRETVSAYGITRPPEAMRKAMWHCKANRYITGMVSFETGVDAIACEPGDRIEVQHDVPQWGHGGRVVSSGDTSIVLDQQVTLEAGQTYQVMVRHNADDTLETRTVQDSAGTYWTLTVLPAWTLNPAADDVWAVGVTAIVTKPFIVTSISRSGDLECKVEAIEYVEDAYDDDIETIEHVTYSALPDPRAIPDSVTNLVATERVQILNDGTLRNVIDVTYSLPTGCTRANVYWRENGTTPWIQAGRPYTTQYTIESGVVHGITYDVCVAAVSPYGIHRNPAACDYVTLTIQGRTTPPSNVTNVRVTLVGNQVYIRWDAVTDADLGGYEIRYGASTWATCTILGQTKVAEYQTPNVSGGNATYFQVKAYNTSGIYSTTAAWQLVTLPERYGENIIVERNEVTEGWNGTKTDTEVNGDTHLILDQNRTSPAVSGTYETPVIDCAASVRPLVSVWLKVSQSYAGLIWSGATFTWGSAAAQAMTWGGPAGESHVTASLQFKYGDALDTSGNVEGTYATFQVGEYSGRYFQFKLTLAVDSTQYNGVVEEMVVTCDVPDLFCSASEVDVAASGSTTVTFTTAAPGFSGFHIAPHVVAVPFNPAAPGDFVRIDSVAAASFVCRYYNAAGSQAAGHCAFIAKGY